MIDHHVAPHEINTLLLVWLQRRRQAGHHLHSHDALSLCKYSLPHLQLRLGSPYNAVKRVYENRSDL